MAKLREFAQSFDPFLEVETSELGRDASVKIRYDRFDIILSEIYLPDMRGDIMLGCTINGAFKIGMTAFLADADMRRSFDAFIEKPLIKDDFNRAMMTAKMNLLFA